MYLKLLWTKEGLHDAKVSLFGRGQMKLIQIQKIQNLLQLGFASAAEKKGEQGNFNIG